MGLGIIPLETLDCLCDESVKSILQHEWPSGIPITDRSLNRALELNLDLLELPSAIERKAHRDYRAVCIESSKELGYSSDTVLLLKHRNICDEAKAKYKQISNQEFSEYRELYDSAQRQFDRTMYPVMLETENICTQAQVEYLKTHEDLYTSSPELDGLKEIRKKACDRADNIKTEAKRAMRISLSSKLLQYLMSLPFVTN